MTLTYYGHSCFSVIINEKVLLFDPFITPNPLAKDIRIEDIKADYILLSHGHGDHIADCVQLAKQNHAMVIGAFEVTEWLNRQGVENYHPMNHGGQRTFDFGTVKCTNAVHSSSMPDGSYGGNPMGFLVKGGGKTFYYSGDTALHMDMQLIPDWGKPDFAILPIGDNFTMGIDDAVRASGLIQCKKIAGVHYDTFGFIRIDHEKAKKAFSNAGLELYLPAIGESIDI